MSEGLPRKKFTKEEVAEKPRIGLASEGEKREPVLKAGSKEKRKALRIQKYVTRWESGKPPFQSPQYRKALKAFERYEHKLQSVAFDTPDASAPSLDLTKLRAELEALRKERSPQAFAGIYEGISAMNTEIERRKILVHEAEAAEAAKLPWPVEKLKREKKPKAKQHEAQSEEAHVEKEAVVKKDTEPEKGALGYAKPYYGPTDSVPGPRPLMSRLDNLRMQSKLGKSAATPEAAPEAPPEPPPAPPAAAEAAPPVAKQVEKKEAQPKSAPQEEFFVGDGPNDTWAPEKAPSEPVAPEDSFEFVGDGPNDVKTPEKAKEARSELKRIIEEFYGGEHSLEPDVREESPPPSEPKEETHKGGVYAAVWTGRPEDVNPNPKEGRPAAEIVPPGVETTMGIPKAPMYEAPLPEWVAERKKKEAEGKKEDEDDSFLGRLKRAFK